MINQLLRYVAGMLFLLFAGWGYMGHLDRQVEIKFGELTQYKGAWSQDRAYVTEHCGFNVNELPSMKR